MSRADCVRAPEIMLFSPVTPPSRRSEMPGMDPRRNQYTARSSPKLHVSMHSHSSYRRVDSRKSEEREIEKNCTFSPQVIGDSPFISERTLRKYIEKQRRRPPPPPPESDPSIGGLRHGAGFFGRAVGGVFNGTEFIPGPPDTAGMPIFLYDLHSPPSFETGKYTTTHLKLQPASGPAVSAGAVSGHNSTVPLNALNTGQIGLLLAPPFPSWATGSGGDPSRGGGGGAKKPLKLVITKKDRSGDAGAPPAATGWQAIMAELAKKKDGGLKKAEPAKPTKPLPGKLKKSSKKSGGGGFVDMMDELAHRLAKRRGEVVDSDEEEADEAGARSKDAKSSENIGSDAKEGGADNASKTVKPKGKADMASLLAAIRKDPPKDEKEKDESDNEPKPGKLKVKPELANLLSGIGKPKGAKPAAADKPDAEKPGKLKVKPDLANLLSAIGKPKGAPAGADAQPSSAATPSRSSATSQPTAPGATLAVAKPKRIPKAPPIPSSWPPTPYTAPPAGPLEDEDEEDDDDGNSKFRGGNEEEEAGRDREEKVRPAGSTVTGPATAAHMVAELISKDLPMGYYMPASGPGIVEPGQILPGGVTTVALCQSLKLMIATGAAKNSVGGGDEDGDGSHGSIGIDAMTPPATPAVRPAQMSYPLESTGFSNRSFAGGREHEYGFDPLSPASATSTFSSAKKMLEMEGVLANKLTISDLPLPPSFNSTVERMRKGNLIRESKRAVEFELELRNYLSSNYVGECASAAARAGGVGSDNTSTKHLQQQQQQQQHRPQHSTGKLTIPIDYRSHLQQHLEQKLFSHRKSAITAGAAAEPARDDTLPAFHRLAGSQRSTQGVFTSVEHRAVDSATAHWLTELRPSLSQGPQFTSTRSISSPASVAKAAAAAHAASANLSRLARPQDAGNKTGVQGLHVSDNRTGSAANADWYRASTYRAVTEGRAPDLHAHRIASRRQSLREERKRLERKAAQEAKHQEKAHKEWLKQRALLAAEQAGVRNRRGDSSSSAAPQSPFDSAAARFRRHQRLMEKFSPQRGQLYTEIGYDVRSSAQKAFQDYAEKHNSYCDPFQRVAAATATAIEQQQQHQQCSTDATPYAGLHPALSMADLHYSESELERYKEQLAFEQQREKERLEQERARQQELFLKNEYDTDQYEYPPCRRADPRPFSVHLTDPTIGSVRSSSSAYALSPPVVASPHQSPASQGHHYHHHHHHATSRTRSAPISLSPSASSPSPLASSSPSAGKQQKPLNFSRSDSQSRAFSNSEGGGNFIAHSTSNLPPRNPQLGQQQDQQQHRQLQQLQYPQQHKQYLPDDDGTLQRFQQGQPQGDEQRRAGSNEMRRSLSREHESGRDLRQHGYARCSDATKEMARGSSKGGIGSGNQWDERNEREQRGRSRERAEEPRGEGSDLSDWDDLSLSRSPSRSPSRSLSRSSSTTGLGFDTGSTASERGATGLRTGRGGMRGHSTGSSASPTRRRARTPHDFELAQYDDDASGDETARMFDFRSPSSTHRLAPAPGYAVSDTYRDGGRKS